MPDRHGAQRSALDPLIAEVVERAGRRHVGLGVGVVADGAVATAGFGRIRRDGPAPDGRTSFQIGSVTKVFTALLLADAVERGEVTLEQPLDSIIPGVATHPQGRPITLLDLATHTSGLPRLPPGLREQALRHRHDPYAHFTTAQLTEALGHPPPRPPGGKPRYSNYGAGVLGEALARATGRSFGELVQERITGPLAMAATTIERPASPGSVADGHSRRRRPVADWQLPALPGAGALRSSVDDLLSFVQAHLQPFGSPLRPAIQLAREPRATANRQLSVALGWHVLERRQGTPWWWHNGGTGGFFSFVGFDPVASVGVVVLSNTARSVDRLGAALLQRLTD
jgi:serine-type D-Ala-D-Ala carboxypeptidase/endopeptidase